MNTIADNLHRKFFKGIKKYAIARTDADGNLAYFPVEEEADPSLVESHLLGDVVLGAYNLHGDSKVSWIAFDVDSSNPEAAKELTLKLHVFLGNVPHVVEFSGRKGYHVIIFLRNRVEADRAKNLGEEIRQAVGGKRGGDPHIEVFPKQAKLTTSNPFGNLLKLPLGIHPVTGIRSQFLNPDENWKVINPLSPNVFEQKATLAELAESLLRDKEEEEGEKEDPINKIIDLMRPYWMPGQRHEVALHLSGFLARSNWIEEDTLEVVERLQEEEGGDLHNLLACVHDTYQKRERDEAVSGIDSLSEILPPRILRQLTSIALQGDEDASPIAIIDKIRLGKSASHLKVRSSSDEIIKYLKNTGDILRDSQNQEMYWLSRDDHNLYQYGSISWEMLLLNTFGINYQEGFGRQVTRGVYASSTETAQTVRTHTRSWWTGKELWINLGANKNYILSGDDVNGSGWNREVYNGEEGIIFRNRDSNLRLDLGESRERGVKPGDPWKYLINDLNFSIGSSGTSPLQQRELVKAWYLSTFFPNIMPTRPILTIVASPGAGKTTAARRFLKVLEGPNSDVMGLQVDKPDSLRASLSLHKFIVLDNLEKSKAAWLTDLLNRISTGTHIELRRLHTTNETQIITPDCFVILTATSLPFSEESLFSRILPLELAPLASPIPEYTMQKMIMDNLESIWMGTFRILNEAVANLLMNTVVPSPTESRLADFSIFCSRLRNMSSYLDGEALISGLEMMVNRQKALLWESSPLIQVLDIWMQEDMRMHGGRQQNTLDWKTASELNSELRIAAGKHKTDWPWETGQALSLHMRTLEAHLTRLFGLRVKKGDGKHTSHQYRWERGVIELEQKTKKKEEEEDDTGATELMIDLNRDRNGDES